jgi:hypothetical protein
MGMFDWVEFKGHKFQTKDTPRQMLDEYRIDSLGQLWEQQYDSKWAESDGLFGGHINQINQRWVECAEFSGCMRFYRENKEAGGWSADAWIEYEAEFKNGQMIDLKLLAGDHFLTWYRDGIEKRGLE